MKITKINVGEVKNSNIIGMASVTLDNCLVLKGFKIIQGKKGIFISNPSYKNSKGEFKDIFYVLNKNFREEITRAILDEYTTKILMKDSNEEVPF